jgi:hypothetical protein
MRLKMTHTGRIKMECLGQKERQNKEQEREKTDIDRQKKILWWEKEKDMTNGRSEDQNECGTKEKEEKKWHTKEIERKLEMIQTGRRKVRCCGTERCDSGSR